MFIFQPDTISGLIKDHRHKFRGTKMPSSDAIQKMLLQVDGAAKADKPSETDGPSETNKPSVTGCAICDAEKRSSCRHKKAGGGGGEESGASDSSTDSAALITDENTLLEATLETVSLQLTAHPTDSPTPAIENTNQLTLKPGVTLKDIEDELNEFIKEVSKELNLDENTALEKAEENLGISYKYDANKLTINFSDRNLAKRFIEKLVDNNLVYSPSETKQHTARQEANKENHIPGAPKPGPYTAQAKPEQHTARQKADKANHISGAPNPYTISLTPTPYK
jgi:hypothetical protein